VLGGGPLQDAGQQAVSSTFVSGCTSMGWWCQNNSKLSEATYDLA
jgi:hypothetical protein